MAWFGMASPPPDTRAASAGPTRSSSASPKLHVKTPAPGDASPEIIVSILNGRDRCGIADAGTARVHVSRYRKRRGKAGRKDSVMIVSHHREHCSDIDGQRMLVRRMTRRTRAASAPRQRAPLDAATLILELDMAALVGQAGDSLRQHRDDADQRDQRSWWRRLVGKKRIKGGRLARRAGFELMD